MCHNCQNTCERNRVVLGKYFYDGGFYLCLGVIDVGYFSYERKVIEKSIDKYNSYEKLQFERENRQNRENIINEKRKNESVEEKIQLNKFNIQHNEQEIIKISEQLEKEKDNLNKCKNEICHNNKNIR